MPKKFTLLAKGFFKTKIKLNTKNMEEISTFKNLDYSLRNDISLKIGNLKTVYYGTESLTNLGVKIWNLLPNEYKELKSFSMFKSRISNWVTDKCPCRMCKNYFVNIGFIWSLIINNLTGITLDLLKAIFVFCVCRILMLLCNLFLFYLFIYLFIFCTFEIVGKFRI